MNAVMTVTYQQQTLTLTEQGKARLEEWAKWTRGESSNGYPHITPFARLVTPTPNVLGEMPPDVAATDRAVATLRHRHKSVLWRAIEQYFLKHDAVTVSMRACSTSRAGFYRFVDRACVKIMHLVREQS